MQVMLGLFLTKMLVTMTLHSRQQTHYYATQKSGEYDTTQVLISGMEKNGKFQDFLTKLLIKSAFLTNDK